MLLGRVKNSHRVIALLIVMIASLFGLLLLSPIPQDQNYHDFADQRTLLGIPNFWNVVSNIPFIAVGAAGLWPLRRDPAIIILFLGILLTGFGSAYYHLDPDDSTLFWDRLPMAVSFMAILAIAIEERVDAKAGAIMLWPLIAVGVFSLYLWRWTGDLRLYGWVQFFPCLLVPLLFLLFPPKYTGTSYWFIAAALFALAKLFEFYDDAIYSVGSILSGHTFKHVAAAAACFALLRYFQTSRPIRAESQGMKTRNRKVAKTMR
jgi:Ceramidase